jgi:hypothetical protein
LPAISSSRYPKEILVGGDDRAVHIELDHRLRAADGDRLRQRITRR